jgi:methionine-rich copper-binding protein CopC
MKPNAFGRPRIYALTASSMVSSFSAIGAEIEGQVLGGGAPIGKSTVTLWSAGAHAPRQLGQAQTGDVSRHARVLAVLLFVVCGPADARPLHVRDSTPAAETIVDGRNAQYVVRFDGWVDHATSRMDITENGKVVEPLVPTLDSEADVLAASASELAPGQYQLHWHAKSIPDEDFSDGFIPFTVAR